MGRKYEDVVARDRILAAFALEEGESDLESKARNSDAKKECCKERFLLGSSTNTLRELRNDIALGHPPLAGNLPHVLHVSDPSDLYRDAAQSLFLGWPAGPG